MTSAMKRKAIGAHFAAHEAPPITAEALRFIAEVIYQRGTLLDQIHGAIGRFFGHRHHIIQALSGIGNLRNLSGMWHTGVELEIDDGVMQLTSQLTDFMVKTTVTCLVELMYQLYRFTKVALFQAIYQLASVVFQGRLKVTLNGIFMLHSTLVANISR